MSFVKTLRVVAKQHRSMELEQAADVMDDAADEIESLEKDLRRLWHFAGCPYEHCQTCIDDAEWIKSLHQRLGPPSDLSVMAQRE